MPKKGQNVHWPATQRAAPLSGHVQLKLLSAATTEETALQYLASAEAEMAEPPQKHVEYEQTCPPTALPTQSESTAHEVS